jgi:DNA-directed RNA polymerase subunit F
MDKQVLLRQVAAKIVSFLPVDRDDAHAVLRMAAQFVYNFLHAEPTKGEGK